MSVLRLTAIHLDGNASGRGGNPQTRQQAAVLFQGEPENGSSLVAERRFALGERVGADQEVSDRGHDAIGRATCAGKNRTGRNPVRSTRKAHSSPVATTRTPVKV